MTKAAVKERTAEPALFADMKDVTPKKGDKKPEPEKKSARAKVKQPSKAIAVAEPQRAPAKATGKVRAESLSIIQIAKECAMNPLVDAGKMREVIAMAREEQNRIDDRVFQLAKMEVQNKIPPITRDSKNDHTKSKWARLEKISSIADPIIRRNGFSLSYGSADCPLADHYRITCDVTHTPTGYTKHYWIDVGMDSAGAKGGGTKSLAQGSGSSVTYARRYLKVMIFDINIVGEDFDGSRFTVEPAKHVEHVEGERGEQREDAGPTVPTITQVQDDRITDAIEDCGVKRETFLKHFGIGKVGDLPATFYKDALDACADYKAKHAGK
jgi:hypothetical protein